MEHLARAIEICGSQAELARRLGEPVQQQHVWNWVNRAGGRVPPEQCIPIERAVDGAVTRYDLRPDVFGPAPEIAARPVSEPSKAAAA